MSHRLNATNLRRAAAAAGDHSDYRIAKRSGVPNATLSRLVNGQVEPTVTNLVRLARCYRMPIESLIVDNPAMAATA